MKATGIVRRIDELGRIVVPKEMRTQLGIACDDPVEFYVEGENIIIRKYTPHCFFCGREDNVVEFKDKKICKVCLDEIKSGVSV